MKSYNVHVYNSSGHTKDKIEIVAYYNKGDLE